MGLLAPGMVERIEARGTPCFRMKTLLKGWRGSGTACLYKIQGATGALSFRLPYCNRIEDTRAMWLKTLPGFFCGKKDP